MKLSVIGVGYLGAVHAATMASVGHDVVAVDSDEGRVAALASGTAPFVEPGFDGLLRQTLDSGRLHFTADYRDVAEAGLHFIAVGTPQRPDSHAADLTHVYAAVGSLLPHIRP
ncbi:MAG: UDP-glucose 6-dehydrogenase, partial [Peptidiphaga sp.]